MKFDQKSVFVRGFDCFNFHWSIGFFLEPVSDPIKQKRVISLETDQKNNGVVKIIQLDGQL